MASGASAVVERFNEAFNRHDVDAIMAHMTDDCVFENTRPAPDGSRIEGHEAVRAFWVDFFRRSGQAHFEAEEVFEAGDRCVVRWRRSEEHTSELQSQFHLVCRLLLEKKNY